MTTAVRIQLPRQADLHEAVVTQVGTAGLDGRPVNHYLAPGDEIDLHVHSGMKIEVCQVKAGMKAQRAGSALPNHIAQTVGELSTDPRFEKIESPLLLAFAQALLNRVAV